MGEEFEVEYSLLDRIAIGVGLTVTAIGILFTILQAIGYTF